jgi:calcineurin-like phosphoesterase family protein
MDRVMRDSWCSTVTADDDVICLGDFAHRAEPKALRRLFDSLPGRKHLVIGNHDGQDTLALPWSSPPRDVLFCSVESTRLVLCHYAMRVWPSMHKGSTLHLYGHSHGRLAGNCQSMDIGVDVMGWAPVRLSAIKQRLAQLPPLIDPEASGQIENTSGGAKP